MSWHTCCQLSMRLPVQEDMDELLLAMRDMVGYRSGCADTAASASPLPPLAAAVCKVIPCAVNRAQ